MAITQGFTAYFSNRQYMVTTLTDLMKAAMWRWEVPHANGKLYWVSPKRHMAFDSRNKC